jgi:cytochrome P450
VACSPVATARDNNLFPEADKFIPQRWLSVPDLPHTGTHENVSTEPNHASEFNEEAAKKAHRTGSSVHFGKGQHACLGEKLGRMMVMEILWDAILGTSALDAAGGFDVEIVGGLREGVGVDGVGVVANWAEENLGTPFERGAPVMVRFRKRV